MQDRGVEGRKKMERRGLEDRLGLLCRGDGQRGDKLGILGANLGTVKPTRCSK